MAQDKSEYTNIFYEEIKPSRIPPPITPRKSLAKKKAAHQQLNTSLTQHLTDDAIYDDPVVSMPPPAYPPPALPSIDLDNIENNIYLPFSQESDSSTNSCPSQLSTKSHMQERAESPEKPLVPPRLIGPKSFSKNLNCDIISQINSSISSIDFKLDPVDGSLFLKDVTPEEWDNEFNSIIPPCPPKLSKLPRPNTESLSYSRTPSMTSSSSQGSSRMEIMMNVQNQASDNKCGYLWKTGPDRKTFLKRWCVLSKESLVYYVDDINNSSGTRESKIMPKGSISLKDVNYVSSCLVSQKLTQNVPVPSSKMQRTFSAKPYNTVSGIKSNTSAKMDDLWCFEIGVKNQKGRQYLFGTYEDESVGRSWLAALAKNIKPNHETYSFSNSLELCGYLHIKKGISGIWSLCWVVLLDRRVVITSPQDVLEDAEETMEIDLRKVMSVSHGNPHQITGCASVEEPGLPFCLHRPQDLTLYLQADFISQTNTWFQLIMKAWIIPSNGQLRDQFLTNDNVPIAVEKCLNFVSTYGGLITQGIYRLSGQKSKAQSIYEILKSNNKKIWELHLIPENGYDVHDVVSALKMYLKSFSECILTDKLARQWMENNVEDNKQERLRNMKILLTQLPPVNYCTLKRIVCHLISVVENSGKNQMVLINLAPVFGPNIFFLDDDDQQLTASLSMDILTDLITSYAWLFDVTTEELAKEEKILRALTLLREAKISHKPSGDILVGIYVYDKEWGKNFNVSLTPKMTAEDLIQYTIKQANLKVRKGEKLGVFEVVCSDQLERALHHTEIVLEVVLSWTSDWMAEDAKSNYIIIKPNFVYETIAPIVSHAGYRSSTIPISIFSEVKFSDLNWGKTFKKVLFEFSGAKLSCYKDAKANKVLGEWNIEDIVWYFGAEAKRGPPSKFCFTFIERNKSVTRSKEFVGRVVSCNTQQEIWKWIAGMVVAQYPNGLFAVKDHIDLLD